MRLTFGENDLITPREVNIATSRLRLLPCVLAGWTHLPPQRDEEIPCTVVALELGDLPQREEGPGNPFVQTHLAGWEEIGPKASERGRRMQLQGAALSTVFVQPIFLQKTLVEILVKAISCARACVFVWF